MAGGPFDLRVRGALGDVDIEVHPRTAISEEEMAASLRAMSRLVAELRYREPTVRRVLGELHARLRGYPVATAEFDVGSAAMASMGSYLMRAARAGQVVVRSRVHRLVAVPIETVEEQVLGPEAEPTDWIAIVVVDDDDKPIPSVAYRIECDDGRVRTGSTDSYGKAREDGLSGANAKVSFPFLNPPDWSKVA
jgi:hypothetical protein